MEGLWNGVIQVFVFVLLSAVDAVICKAYKPLQKRMIFSPKELGEVARG
ncbi:MAG: hypothetical protein ACQET7_12610 [Thermodesulfobacteriota bacterium]